MAVEQASETAKLRLGQEALPPLAPVAADARAGIAAVRAVAVNLRCRMMTERIGADRSADTGVVRREANQR